MFINLKIVFVGEKFKLKYARKILKSPRKDKCLIAQGGGVKAFVTLLGYLSVFEQHKYCPWKLLAGTSISSLVFSFYLSGTLKDENYVQGLLTAVPRYVRHDTKTYGKAVYSSLFKTENVTPVFDLDSLVDDSFESGLINTKRILKSRAEFYLTLTQVNDAEGVLVDVKDFLKRNSEDDFRELLKASMNFPIFSTSQRYVQGVGYVDGGITYPLPFQAAVYRLQPFDRMLFLLSDSFEFVRKPLDFISKFLLKNVYGADSRLFRKLLKVDKVHNEAQSFVKTMVNFGISSAFYASPNSEVGLLTTDAEKLLREFYISRIAANEFLRQINYLR